MKMTGIFSRRMTGFRFAVVAAFMVLGGLAASQVVQAQNTPHTTPADQTAFEISEKNAGSEREYSDLEKRIAREVIATGRMLEGDPRLDDVVQALATRGADLIPAEGPRLGIWVERQLQELIPKTGNAMADAALIAAGREMAGTLGKSAGSLMGDVRRIPFDRDLEVNTEGMDSAITKGLMRGLAEGGRAAAHESDIYALANLEFDYTLGEGGFDEYSLLAVQPLYESFSKRHNIFAQASYSNREVEDLGADTRSHRDTLNAGLAYRYITPDEQHMLGVNAFIDHEFDYNHNRMSVGLDYKNALIGAHLNRYIGLSSWRGRNDGFEEKALSGTDLELSGRLPNAPEIELFARGFNWEQERTPIFEPDGDDIWGYELSAEYTPVNIFTLRGAAIKDNTMDSVSAEVTFRLNYTLGQDIETLGQAPRHNLDSVLDRRFEKVRRQNDIRVQVRQDPEVTATVTFAQGANVTTGQNIPFGTTITTGPPSSSATLEFGNGAVLDIAADTDVLIEADTITLLAGMVQFVSGGSNIMLGTPGESVELQGTDVDLRVNGNTTTLRVRDGAAVFTDDTGPRTVNETELARTVDGDNVIPQLIAAGDADFDGHVTTALNQLTLTGPSISVPKAAPAAKEAVDIAGTLESGQSLTFTVPLSRPVTVTGSPELNFTLGIEDRTADFDPASSGTDSLIFTYDVVTADEGLEDIEIEPVTSITGGTITGTNGAPLVRQLSGGRSGSVADAIAPTVNSITANAGPHFTGGVITITLDANEDLVASGTPTLTLDIGGATQTADFSAIASGNAGFTYTVQSGDQDADGFEVTAITAAPGELTDAAGNDLDTTGATPVDTGELVNTALIERGSETTANLNGAIGVAVAGNFAYVTSFSADSLTVVDISDPDNPMERGSETTANLNGAQGVAVAGNFAYVASFDADSLTVVDISDPDNPMERGSVSNGTTMDDPRGVAVAGNFAYVASRFSNSLTVVDISDPDNPVERGSVSNSTTMNSARGVAVAGNFAYVASLLADSLTVVDISDPDNPVERGSVSNSTTMNSARGVAVAGNFAYVAASDADSLTVVDISDPDNPMERGSVSTANMNDAHSVAVSGNFAYVASLFADSLTVVDISDPDNPVEIDSITSSNLDGARGVAVTGPAPGDFAYVASQNADSLTAIEITLP